MAHSPKLIPLNRNKEPLICIIKFCRRERSKICHVTSMMREKNSHRRQYNLKITLIFHHKDNGYSSNSNTVRGRV